MNSITRRISNIRIAILCYTESEEINIIVPYVVWKRAGIIVDTVSSETKTSIFLQSGIKTTCSNSISKVNLDQYNAIYIPGGRGFERLYDKKVDKKIIEKVTKFIANPDKKSVFASGEASIFLKDLCNVGEKKMTTAPGFEERLGRNFKDGDVVVSKNIITYRSSFHAFEFALLVIEKFLTKQIAVNVAQDIRYKHK